MKLKYYCRHRWIVSTTNEIAQNGQNAFILVPQVRTREKGKQEEKTLRMDKSKYTSETGYFGQRLLTMTFLNICQSVFTCSKSTLKTPEQYVAFVQI